MWLAASQETLHRLIDERERSADQTAARDFDADPLDDAVDLPFASTRRSGGAIAAPRGAGCRRDGRQGNSTPQRRLDRSESPPESASDPVGFLGKLARELARDPVGPEISAQTSSSLARKP